ncbi:hypothetical protein [Aeromicrobium sp. UC242_57]|uniref:nucleotide-binding protein n=1 Tax=Aeromicrobium sp. UC242_57 TaxID=3374624 RepID=UPI0037B04DCA
MVCRHGLDSRLAHDLAGVRRTWRQASGVVVGEDLVSEVADAGLARREHVIVLAREPSAHWPAAIALGAEVVCGPDEERRILDVLAAALDGRDEACVVSVIAGSGGAGASTLVAALAVTAARRGLRSLAVDADPLGGGLELLLGPSAATVCAGQTSPPPADGSTSARSSTCCHSTAASPPCRGAGTSGGRCRSRGPACSRRRCADSTCSPST